MPSPWTVVPSVVVGCLTSCLQAGVSPGRICSIYELPHLEAAYFSHRPTSPSADPVTPGTWRVATGVDLPVGHWFDSAWGKVHAESRNQTLACCSRAGRLTTGPTRQSVHAGPLRWPSGQGVRLESGRYRVRIPFAPGFFSGSRHTSDLKIGTPVATLLGAWHYGVSARTGRPGVSVLWLGEMDSWVCNFYISVAARTIVLTLACCWDVNSLDLNALNIASCSIESNAFS